MHIREVQRNELEILLELYAQLHDNHITNIDEHINDIWEYIIKDKCHHIIGGFIDGILVSSCVLIIVPNLTHSQRPYALIENVITDKLYRGKGYAISVLNYAKVIAEQHNCYKIMLLTGSKEESTLSFYEKAGYNRNDKTAFIQWL